MRKVATTLGMTCFLALGCQRAEGGATTEFDSTKRAAAVEPHTLPSANADLRTPSSPAPVCVVPMTEPPRPQAKPAERCPLAPDIAVPPAHGRITFVESKTKQSVDVELAESPTDQQRGLMYRTHLAEDAGMLFSWPNERIRTFWMHNTCLPLDMLFITKDGIIAGILEQVPVLNDDPRSIPCAAAHVLELNAGYCRKHGIMPGQRLRIDSP